MKLLTLTFWKSVWIWCKVNWKFLVGFALPVLAGILLRKNKQNEILKKGLKFRKDQLLIEKEAAGIETSAKATAVEKVIIFVSVSIEFILVAADGAVVPL